MYARVISVDVDVGKVDAGIEGLEKAVQELMKKWPDYPGLYLLVDRDANKAMTITLWENKEASDRTMQSGDVQDIISKLSEFMAGTPTIGGYEVAMKP